MLSQDNLILDSHVKIFCWVMGAMNNIKFLNQRKFSVTTSYLMKFGCDGTVHGAYVIFMLPSLFSSKLLTFCATV